MLHHSTKEYNDIYKKVEKLCEGKGTLLYLVKFGSHLYGTHSENSDSDYKGVFLPDIKNLLLEKKYHSINYQTSTSDTKNSCEDIDIDLWSLQHWFSLLKQGDINAIDLLFSYTNKNTLLYCSPLLEKTDLFITPIHYINLRENTAYITYIHHQTKKYGLQGTRLHLLKSVYEYVLSSVEIKAEAKTVSNNGRFGEILPNILEKFYDEKLCFEKKDNQGLRTLFLLGSGFQERICISEAIKRLETTYKKHGERAIQAEQNENIDWKAISHAMRCILQLEELAKTSHLTFPLKDAEYLKKIKSAKFTWQECEKDIVENLEKLNHLIETLPINKNIDDFHEKLILDCYPLNCLYCQRNS